MKETEGTRKSRATLHYGTPHDKTEPETKFEEWIPFRKKKDKDLYPDRNNDNEQSFSVTINGKNQITPRKAHVNNRKPLKEPYTEVYTLENTDGDISFRRGISRLA